MKKLLMILVPLMLIFCAVFVTVFAEESSENSCGDNLTWSFNESTGELTISGTGDMDDYGRKDHLSENNSTTKTNTDEFVETTTIPVTTYPTFPNEKYKIRPWVDLKEQITTVVIEDGVTSIGEFAFYDCENLTKVIIGESVSYIRMGAFWNCSGITTLEMPVSAGIYDYTTFFGCKNIQQITLTKGDGTTNHYYIKSTPWYIGRCSEVVVKEGVTTISSEMFSGCTALTSIELPNSIKFIENGAFKNCTNLVNINIGDNVSNIGQDAFYNTGYYNDIKNWENDVLYISNYVIKAKNSIIGEYQVKPGTKTISDYAFSNCKGLVNVIIPDSVTSIGMRAFEYCTGITEVKLPISAEFNSNYIDDCLSFRGCRNIKKVTLTKGNGHAKKYHQFDGYAFSTPWHSGNCTEVIIEDGIVAVGDYMFLDCDSLVNVSLGDQVSSIGSSAFENCNSLKTITIPESVNLIDKNAFACCRSLEYVRFEGSNSINISNEAFFDSSNAMICCYENSYLHSYADANDMKVCLYDKNGIPSFEIKNDVLVSYRGNAADVFVSSGAKVGYGAFENNENIEKVELSSAITRVYDNAFKNCSTLKTIIIPQAVSSIGDNAFEGCDDLTIYGYSGSYAESYAKKHSIDFEYITLTISADEYEANVFDTFVLEPSFNVLRNEADEIVWSCEDNGVISVSSNGEVTALKEGSAIVTATAESGLFATCLVKVQNSEPEVKGKVNSVSVSDISLEYKASATITPTISADSGVKYTVTYSSSDPSVASIDANGKVSTGKTGSATITVTVTDEFGNTVSDTCEVKVNYNWWQWIIVIVLFGWIWY